MREVESVTGPGAETFLGFGVRERRRQGLSSCMRKFMRSRLADSPCLFLFQARARTETCLHAQEPSLARSVDAVRVIALARCCVTPLSGKRLSNSVRRLPALMSEATSPKPSLSTRGFLCPGTSRTRLRRRTKSVKLVEQRSWTCRGQRKKVDPHSIGVERGSESVRASSREASSNSNLNLNLIGTVMSIAPVLRMSSIRVAGVVAHAAAPLGTTEGGGVDLVA